MSMTPVAQPHHLSRQSGGYIRQSTGHQDQRAHLNRKVRFGVGKVR